MPLTKLQYKKLQEAVAQTVKETVNGKIDRMNDKLDRYIEEDNRWKENAQPAITKMNDLTTGWKFILAVFGAIGVIAGSVVALKKLFNQ